MDSTLTGFLAIVVLVLMVVLISKGIKRLQLKRSHSFKVAGFVFIYDRVKDMVYKKLMVGDKLQLQPQPTNEYDDKAVSVIFNDEHIGWVPKNYKYKKDIFKHLMKKGEVKADCKRFIKNIDHEIITVKFQIIR